MDGRFKFCVLVFGGSATTPHADFVFFAHCMNDLETEEPPHRSVGADLALLNPNTRTCPIFRSRRDAEMTKDIYRRVPILIDEARQEGGNPWGIRFVTMFDQTNDAELFHARRTAEMGCRLEGNRWTRGADVSAAVRSQDGAGIRPSRRQRGIAEANWVRQGQTEDTTLVEHQNPEFVVQPRWWVEEEEVARSSRRRCQPAYLCFKDVTSPTNQRTMIAALIPPVAVVNSAPLMLTAMTLRRGCLLPAGQPQQLRPRFRRSAEGRQSPPEFLHRQPAPAVPARRLRERCPWDRRQLEKMDLRARVEVDLHGQRPEAVRGGGGFRRRRPQMGADKRAELPPNSTPPTSTSTASPVTTPPMC